MTAFKLAHNTRQTGSWMPLGLMTVTSSSPFPALNVSTVNRAGAPTLLPLASKPEHLFTQKPFTSTQCKHLLHFSICDTGAQNPSLVDFGFFIESYSTLHLLRDTFYRIKISRFEVKLYSLA